MTDYIKTQQNQQKYPQEISNYDFVFITPRIWGYHIKEKDVWGVFHQAGLLSTERKVKVYTDLQFYLLSLQSSWGLFLRSLRKCLYCTFFVDIGASGYNSLNVNLDAFESGTSPEYAQFYKKAGCIPVKNKTMPSPTENSLDILQLCHNIEDYIITRIFGAKSEKKNGVRH